MKKSLISAIKKLFAKLGAEEVEGNNLVEVIDKGADAIKGGGGSGEVFVVTITFTGDIQNATKDKTDAEIVAAVAEGKIIEVVLFNKNHAGGTGVASIIPILSVVEKNGELYITCMDQNISSSGATNYQVRFTVFYINDSGVNRYSVYRCSANQLV